MATYSLPSSIPTCSCRLVIGGGARLSKEMFRGLFASNSCEVLSEDARDYEALRLAVEKHHPDVALVLPWVGGVQELSEFIRLRDIQPDLGLVFLLRPYDTLGTLAGITSTGGVGIIDSEASFADLMYTIYLVKSGYAILSPEVVRKIPRWSAAPFMPRRLPDNLLSQQELTSLQCIARGLKEQAIATRMGVSVRTVQAYVAQARDKLSASNAAHAVALALEAGLITSPSSNGDP